MDFLDPSSSSNVINRMFPCKLSKIDQQQKKDWTEFEVGPECFECACSPMYSCGVAYSRKEVIWILKSTKSPNRGKSSPSDVPQRVISCVKLISKSTIYEDTWSLNPRRKKNMSWSLFQSLLMDSGYLSKLQGRIDFYNFRVAALDHCWGMHFILFDMMKIPY